ncbi:MAG: hypothetical protein KC593_15080 [Myxococcales bacterium]|nr:hypothetical protein [Myxococcales bacterium]MCB9626195.1 hypothetical protein [Sandaracinaceae bacterium]
MAKPILLRHEGTLSSLDHARVERRKLYGYRKRVALDPSGEPCTRAALTDDGALLIRAGMTAQGYFDEAGEWIPSKELVGLGADGEPLPLVPSSLGEERELEGPVPATQLLDHAITAVYALTPLSLDAALAESLRAGAVYRFAFNPRADYREDFAFLVSNPDGALFALAGQPVSPQWLTLAQASAAGADDDESDDDELDFEMF